MKLHPFTAAMLVLVVSSAPALQAQEQDRRPDERSGSAAVRRTVAAVRLTGPPPRVDGVLDDEAWTAAQPATDFVQRAPEPGAPATLPTETRILFDDGALYVAMRMYDPHPDSITAPVGRRDMGGVPSDWAHVIVDSYNDKRTAFRFSVNPAGVQKDAFLSGDTNEDRGWDAVWEVAARVDAEGWVAEYRIPLSQLRFNVRGGDAAAGVWGLQLTREIARRTEIADWSEVRPDRPGFVSQFAELTGMTGLRPPRRLEFLPYTLARVTRAPAEAGNPFYRSSDMLAGVGADLKYGLSPSLTLTATVNPDFGQVDADPSQVNLTAFESFYSERRPFFTEGSDIFRFDVSFPGGVRGTGFGNDQPFYSRRLGRQPQGYGPGGFEYYDRPQSTTILGAAKLSGKTASGWSLGLIDALTAREEVRYIDAGVERSAAVEPATNYLVARAIRDFAGGTSAIGGIATAVNRRLGDEGLDFLPEAAYVVGLDGRHRFGGGGYEVRGAILGTHVGGSEEAIGGIQRRAGHYFQRPDADHLQYDPTRTSLGGWLADLKVQKVAGAHVRGGLYAHARSPGLEMNDAGFQRSADWILQGIWAAYGQLTPRGAFRRWTLSLNGWNGTNFGGERMATGFNLNGNGTFKRNWGLYFAGSHEMDALRTDALRGGPAILGPGYSTFNAGYYSDDRRMVNGEVYAGGWREWESQGGGYSAGAYLAVRPGGRFRLSVGPDFSKSRDTWAYVAQPAEDRGEGPRHYVFGRLDQTVVSMTTRLDYALTPRLTLQFYAQPFVAAGHYDRFREVTDPRADRFADRLRIFGPELVLRDGEYQVDLDGDAVPEYGWGQPDFNFKELRSNLVMRWEYRPGSTVFLVWSQGRQNFDDPGSFRLGRDLARLFDGGRAPSTNTLLLKVNYWLDL